MLKCQGRIIEMWIKGDRGLERLQIANFHLEDSSLILVILFLTPNVNRINQIRINPRTFARRRLKESNVRSSRRRRINSQYKRSVFFWRWKYSFQDSVLVSQADQNPMKGSNDRITRRFIHFQSFYKYARSKERAQDDAFRWFPQTRGLCMSLSREFAFSEFLFPSLAIFIPRPASSTNLVLQAFPSSGLVNLPERRTKSSSLILWSQKKDV